VCEQEKEKNIQQVKNIQPQIDETISNIKAFKGKKISFYFCSQSLIKL